MIGRRTPGSQWATSARQCAPEKVSPQLPRFSSAGHFLHHDVVLYGSFGVAPVSICNSALSRRRWRWPRVPQPGQDSGLAWARPGGVYQRDWSDSRTPYAPAQRD